MPVYPPSTFLALAPLALLQFPVARWAWFLLTGLLLVISAGLILSVCPPQYRWLSTTLVAFILLTAGILLVLGQPGVFAISLIIMGCCLFLRGRLLPLAALLLLLSLAVKPQIGGFIVLYLVVRGIHWRYAAVALAGAGALLLCGSLMLDHQQKSADWRTTLRSNLTSTLSPGGSADPRPQNFQSIGDVNLQTLSSIFVTDARKYNALAYAGFLLLMAIGVVAMVRAPRDPDAHFLALAVLSILTLMPVYHRFYDTRLLLLSIPAVIIIFKKRRLLGFLLVLLTVLATVSVQYRIQMFLVQHGKWQSIIANKFLLILLLRQQNLELLLLYCLYLVAIFSLRFQQETVVKPDPIAEAAVPLQAR